MTSPLHRRMTLRGRNVLYAHATKRFREPELRTIEAAALELVLASLEKDAEAIQADMEIFRKYHAVASVREFRFTHDGLEVDVPGSVRTFTKPNGEVVERKNKHRLEGYTPTDLDIHSENVKAFLAGQFGNLWIKKEAISVFLPKSYVMPTNLSQMHVSSDRHFNYDTRQHEATRLSTKPETSWIRQATLDLVLAYAIAVENRMKAEIALVRVICKVIKDAKSWGDVIAIWPEAAEVEALVFPIDHVEKSKSLVLVLNDDEKALICNHMSRRGVVSSMCQAELSPALAQQAVA